MNLTEIFGLFPFTGPQARDAGLSYSQWKRLKPRLVLVRSGVYLTAWASDARTRHCQRVASALLTRTDHFAVGTSAVALLGLPSPYFTSWDDVPVHIAGPQARRDRGISRDRSIPIPTPWGLCTDPIDTAVRVAGELPLPQALMVTDAIARHLADTNDRFDLASEACRVEVRRRLTRTSDLPALRLANPAAEACSESFYRGHMLLSGYPDPACGVPWQGASGAWYFIDILEGLLAIEVDGQVKYSDRDGLMAEKRREDDLRATGVHFLRAWVPDVYEDPAAEMTRLARRSEEIAWLGRRSA